MGQPPRPEWMRRVVDGFPEGKAGGSASADPVSPRAGPGAYASAVRHSG